MKYNCNIIRSILKICCKGIVILSILISPLYISGQGLTEKNKVSLIGQVINQSNGGPIKEQKITICSDSTYNPDFKYHSIVYTDNEGYFYDTISTSCNKGALFISTLDYIGNNYDTTVYFRFNWSEVNFLFPNFILPTEPPQVFYQANFYYQRNPSGQNPSEYQFYDLTNACNILSYLWDFSDGTFSSEVNPLHIFSQSGIYRVKLTVIIQPEPNVNPITSSIIKVIHVTIKNYFYLGGHVMAGFFPIDYGEAYLYKIETNGLGLIDTAIFNDTLGYYLFPQVIEGEYIVKADLCPNSIHFNHFMTTYYSNKPMWEEADTLLHHANNCEYDIELYPVTISFAGEGLISGTIIYNFDSGNDKSFPAENVEILLLNNDLEPLICSHSSENGEFSFENLDVGEYYVHAEVTGKYTNPIKVNLSETNPEISGITLTIGSNTVNGNVNAVYENESTFLIGQPYPNPASDDVYINFSLNEISENSVSLFSITGQFIKEYNPVNTNGNEPLVFETKDLNPGIYFIRINFLDQAVIRKFIKK